MAAYLRSFAPELPRSLSSNSNTSSSHGAPAASAFWNRTTPSRSTSDTSLGYRSHSPQHYPQASSQVDPKVRCSDCGIWLEFDELGEHVCARTDPRQMPKNGVDRRYDSNRSNGLKVDVNAAAAPSGVYGANLLARSPSGFLEPSTPLTPSSRPTSPGMSRSYSSQSSTSSNGAKLPFFERYQQMKNTTSPAATNFAGVGANGMSRSGTADNLAELANSRRSPSPKWEHPPEAYGARELVTNSARTRSPASQQPDFAQHAQQIDRRPSPNPSQSSARSFQSAQTNLSSPNQFLTSPDSARSRKISTGERNLNEPEMNRQESRDENRATLKPSQSTPIHLNSYLSATAPSVQPSRSREPTPKPKNSTRDGLDACLEDLRIMTESETLPHSRSLPSFTNSRCTTCSCAVTDQGMQRAGDGQIFCRTCYADRFLPKCRKCNFAIEGSAVTSSDGKVLGKYHKICFTCFSCSVSFPDGEFYVFNHKPYCQLHYHELNGSLCANAACKRPIEGRCVSLVGEENGGGGRYHVEHFVCAFRSCGANLLEHHYVINKLPYCELHADGPQRLPELPTTTPTYNSRAAASRPAETTRAKKRQTIITKR